MTFFAYSCFILKKIPFFFFFFLSDEAVLVGQELKVLETVLNYKKALRKVFFFSRSFRDSARLCKLPIPLKVGIKNSIYSWNGL